MLDVLSTPLPNDKVLAQLFPNGSGASWEQKIFRIENDQVLVMLDLKMREGLRYTFFEIAPSMPKVNAEATRIMGDEEEGIKGIDPKAREVHSSWAFGLPGGNHGVGIAPPLGFHSRRIDGCGIVANHEIRDPTCGR